MISDNIKEQRTKSGLTQKELADKLYVTAQAVSRWENGEVEPSIESISSMATIFGITIDELVGGEEKKPKVETVVEKEYVVKESEPVLALCSKCNKPIYETSDIVRRTHRLKNHTSSEIYCKECDKKLREEEAEKARIKRLTEIEKGKRRRIHSFIWGGLALLAVIGIVLWLYNDEVLDKTEMILGIVAGVLAFPFVSCLILNNNFIGDMFFTVASWGFVKFPGLIFELSLDGIVWLIAVKLAFWVIGIILAILMIILALILGEIVSIFVYPFALGKNIDRPEDTE